MSGGYTSFHFRSGCAKLPNVKKAKSSKVSLGEVAQAAGVSKMAASYALRNRPGVGPATRKRVLAIARRMGYAPDARVTSWMTRVQGATAKELLPIAWLNTTWDKDAWTKFKYLSPYMSGAQERCRQLGYRLEEIWTQQPGMTMRRISQILDQRGIEGVIVTYPVKHIHLQWDHLACVALAGDLLAPHLHRVTNDSHFNLTLALKMLRRHGYRRIGICLPEEVDRFPYRIYRSIAYHVFATVPVSERIPPLFYSITKGEIAKTFTTWVRRYRPEVIVCGTSHLLSWVRALGLRVPEDVGVVHLWLDEDALDWAGIHSNKREIGATAAEQVISMVQNHRFGVPASPLVTLVRGDWQLGKTLLVPKPKKKG